MCKANDTIQGQELTLMERYAVATKPSGRNAKQDERAALPNVIELAVGMKVMVTFNVDTELDVANGARGEVKEIILDERESKFCTTKPIVELDYPPAYVLIKLNRTKAKTLERLENGVLPLTPLQRTFRVTVNGNEQVVTQRQLPLTPAYAFTDYRSQGQTVSNAIIDIAMPPSGGLSPFNVYVALSRGHGRENIRLLRDFDEKLLTTHPSEYLRIEDQRIVKLDQITEQWWDSKKQEAIIDCGNIHAIQSRTNMKDVEML
jgi:ATP-dependent exoDNAse (exonuclease V) alpha subunit